MNVSAANRYDAFLAVREAAARRMDAGTTNVRQETQRLTRTPMAVDHGLASQAALAPVKGQRVDFLA